MISRDMQRPKVTIAIPTLNRVGYLRLTLESALAQTYKEIEIVVSNNASTDATEEYLASISDPRLRILRQPATIPMVDNWNACVAAATGKYFLLLSDDDLLLPEAIETLVAAYEEPPPGQPAPGIVYCSGRSIDRNGEAIRDGRISPATENARDMILAFFQSKRDTWLCSILHRTSDVSPGFRSEFKLGPDAALWMRNVVKYGSAAFVAKRLVGYRVHQNITARTPISEWRQENYKLGELAITVLGEIGKIDEIFKKTLRNEIRRLNIRIAPGLINQSLGHDKPRALMAYGRELHEFLSAYGIRTLIKGALSLFAPAKCKQWLQGVRRRRRRTQ